MPSDTCPLFLKQGVHGKVLAIDLDDTLFTGHHFPEVGGPLPSVLKRLAWLNKRGYEIIIHTSRINSTYAAGQIDSQINVVREALIRYSLPIYEIWTGIGKPMACHYVDDKAWKSLAALVNELEYQEDME